jgi:hypothetical protein
MERHKLLYVTDYHQSAMTPVCVASDVGPSVSLSVI